MKRLVSFLLTVALVFATGISHAQQWARTYGGSGFDYAYSVQTTTDNGMVVAGETTSFGNLSGDLWIVKVDAEGNIAWQKTYGGEYTEICYSIQQTRDGGYIAAGITGSFQHGVTGGELWVLKLDGQGNIQWQKVYSGLLDDEAHAVQQTSDGGYIVAGHTESAQESGNYDVWILKLDSRGNITWQKTYGGSGIDDAWAIQQTRDRGYIVAGSTNSFGFGNSDAWILKLDPNGDIVWQKTYGGSGDDYSRSILETEDGGYIVAGYSNSFSSNGDDDAWVLKLDSNGNILWQKAYGEDYTDECLYSIQLTEGGGVIAAGSAFNNRSDFYILKIDGNGNITWQRTFGGDMAEEVRAIQETPNGGLIVAGYTASFGAGGTDMWVLSLDPNGDIGDCSVEGTPIITLKDTQGRSTNTHVVPEETYSMGYDSSATPVDSTGTTSSQCQYTNPLQDAIEPQINATSFSGGYNYDENHLELAFVKTKEISQSIDLYISLTQPAAEGGTVTYYFTYSPQTVTLPNGIYFNRAAPTTERRPYCTVCEMPSTLKLYAPSSQNPIFNDGWVVPHPFQMGDGVESCQYLPDGTYTFIIEACEAGTENLLVKSSAIVTLNRGCY